MKEIYTQIQIDAPPERVWAHLVDCGRYERWNPFIRKIEGTLAPGSVLSVYFS